eukprot:Gb_26478 [translate_table: standard]
MHLKEGSSLPELVTLSQILTRIAEEEEGYLQNTCRHHPFASMAFSDSRHDLLTKIRFSFLHSGHDHVSRADRKEDVLGIWPTTLMMYSMNVCRLSDMILAIVSALLRILSSTIEWCERLEM